MKKIFLCCGILLSTLFLSCNDIDDQNQEKSQINVSNEISFENNIISLPSKQFLIQTFNDYKSSVNGQNLFNDKVKSLQQNGFKPLTPIFNGLTKIQIEEFVIRKKERLQLRNSSYGLHARDPRDFELDLDDDLIKDPVFAALLNEEREIIIGNDFYKYTEMGLFMINKDNVQVLSTYLDNLTPLQKRAIILQHKSEVSSTTQPQEKSEYLGSGITTFRMANPPHNSDLDGYGGGSSGGGGGSSGGGSSGGGSNDGNIGGVGGTGAGTVVTAGTGSSSGTGTIYGNGVFDPTTFAGCTTDDQGFFEGIFGVSESCTEYYNDNKRVKVTFWTENFGAFSSVGASCRLQKREHLDLILGTISWWEKSYAQQIKLGINSLVYNYNFNVPAFNQAQYNYSTKFFTYNNVNYNINGQVIGNVPAKSSNFNFPRTIPENILDITVCGYDLQVASAPVLNSGIDALVNMAIAAFPDNSVKQQIQAKKDAGTLEVRIVNAPPFSNSVQFIIAKKNYSANNDNAIVKNFDFNFLISYNSNSNSVGDYLQGLNGATSYSDVKADIYGAALHNNFWKGRRLFHAE